MNLTTAFSGKAARLFNHDTIRAYLIHHLHVSRSRTNTISIEPTTIDTGPGDQRYTTSFLFALTYDDACLTLSLRASFGNKSREAWWHEIA